MIKNYVKLDFRKCFNSCEIVSIDVNCGMKPNLAASRDFEKQNFKIVTGASLANAIRSLNAAN